jgi:hypothetical protein
MDGARPELTGAWPSGRSRAQQLAAEEREASGRHGDPSGGDQCGATRSVDWREGEERRARCGEAEMGRIL